MSHLVAAADITDIVDIVDIVVVPPRNRSVMSPVAARWDVALVSLWLLALPSLVMA
ncbi:MAG: hypothetical protein ACXVLX_14780 [Ilumatobacteraceae bacterium]